MSLQPSCFRRFNLSLWIGGSAVLLVMLILLGCNAGGPDTPTRGISSVMVSEKDGMEMVLVPAGEFLMGSPEGHGDENERPEHTVYLDAYYIDKKEVTVAQYQRCVESGACSALLAVDPCTYGSADKADHPINCVPWNEADAYCSWVDRRMPTEAEWEKAARGKDGRIYPWGQSFDDSKVNHCDRDCAAEWADVSVYDGFSETAPVGSYLAGASPYGALDMAGNVSEWVVDWLQSDYYARSPRKNPLGPASGEYRVVRGGSWIDASDSVRVAFRVGGNPDFPLWFNIGFRCARSP